MSGFVATFKDAFDHAGMTPAGFARAVGVRKSFVSMIMSGKKKPPLDRLEAWADALGLTGSQREAFLDEGALQACPERIRVKMAKLMAMVGDPPRRKGRRPA